MSIYKICDFMPCMPFSFRFFISFYYFIFILIKKHYKVYKHYETILKNKQNYTIYDEINGTSFGDMIITI